jgi:hypothetical protein
MPTPPINIPGTLRFSLRFEMFGATRGAVGGIDQAAGMLVPLLRGYKLSPVDVHAIFPGGPRPSAKVRALVDFLVQELK